MAALSVTTPTTGNGNWGTVTITYSTSTSGATHTLSVTGISSSMSGNTSNNPTGYLYYSITYGSTTLKTGALYIRPSGGDSSSLSLTSATTMTHSTQSKALKITITSASFYWTGGREEFGSKSSTATISIAPKPSYAVTYDANGGSGAPSSQTKWYDENMYLSSTKPTRSGYVFKRWNTNTSDTGTAYSPSAQYTGNAALALHAIWNPLVTYDANGGSGAPATQTKTYGTALTLQSGTPTRTGYAFAGWNTAANGSGTAYAAGGTMPASQNAATKLYAQWSKLPDAPTISSLTVVRSDANGAQDDNGTYCKVMARWSIDTANVANNAAVVTGTITPSGGTAAPITWQSGASGTSGTAVALVPNCDTDAQYLITVTITDTRTSTSRAGIMTTAFFILDLKAGGTAMGIGSAAPATGLEVGWPAQFDEAVGMLQGLAVGGNLTVQGNIVADQLKVTSVTSDVVTSSSGWTIVAQKAWTYGKVVMVRCELRPTAEQAPGSRTIGTLASGYRPADLQGFADANGMGTVSSGGSITYRNVTTITTSTTVYVALTYIKG